jgi:hypothetical protein
MHRKFAMICTDPIQRAQKRASTPMNKIAMAAARIIVEDHPIAAIH